MLDFILNSLLWIFALYGLFEIIRNIIYIYTYTNLKADGIYVIVATKNQEETIEGFMRTLIFRCLYGEEDIIKNIMVSDLNSDDRTKEILKKFEQDYNFIKVLEWKDCKDIIDNINSEE